MGHRQQATPTFIKKHSTKSIVCKCIRAFYSDLLRSFTFQKLHVREFPVLNQVPKASQNNADFMHAQQIC